MLAKCANSLCNTPFRRLSEGKLFLLQGEGVPNREALSREKPSRLAASNISGCVVNAPSWLR